MLTKFNHLFDITNQIQSNVIDLFLRKKKSAVMLTDLLYRYAKLDGVSSVPDQILLSRVTAETISYTYHCYILLAYNRLLLVRAGET